MLAAALLDILIRADSDHPHLSGDPRPHTLVHVLAVVLDGEVEKVDTPKEANDNPGNAAGVVRLRVCSSDGVDAGGEKDAGRDGAERKKEEACLGASVDLLVEVEEDCLVVHPREDEVEIEHDRQAEDKVNVGARTRRRVVLPAGDVEAEGVAAALAGGRPVVRDEAAPAGVILGEVFVIAHMHTRDPSCITPIDYLRWGVATGAIWLANRRVLHVNL
mmetsp:Transcript_39862/g.79746  ORF Transcript_39862/g.79746 Transcript_39862/m.79746 type:complete len:218 (+) Transcript_39862:846-1499(+)